MNRVYGPRNTRKSADPGSRFRFITEKRRRGAFRSSRGSPPLPEQQFGRAAGGRIPPATWRSPPSFSSEKHSTQKQFDLAAVEFRPTGHAAPVTTTAHPGADASMLCNFAVMFPLARVDDGGNSSASGMSRPERGTGYALPGDGVRFIPREIMENWPQRESGRA